MGDQLRTLLICACNCVNLIAGKKLQTHFFMFGHYLHCGVLVGGVSPLFGHHETHLSRMHVAKLPKGVEFRAMAFDPYSDILY